jgi:hypothetical protein
MQQWRQPRAATAASTASAGREMPAPRWKDYKKEKRRETAAADHGASYHGKSMAEQTAHKYRVSVADLHDFAEFMDVDATKEPYLLPIVAEAMNAGLPEGWIEVEDDNTGNFYYCNTATEATTWEHPLDQYYKNLLFVERKNYKARARTGHAAASQGDARPFQTQGPTATATPGAGTQQATELFYKAQLQEKEQQLQSLQTELEESAKTKEVLKQLDKAKESRLLKEQNSKLQKEVESYRKKGQSSKGGVGSWLFGKKSSSSSKDEQAGADTLAVAPAPDSGTSSTGAATGLVHGDAVSVRRQMRRQQLEREWLWRLREGTREVGHGVVCAA